VANLARSPKGGDRDQIKAVAVGQCKLALVNNYYLAGMLTSKIPSEVRAAEQVALFWPNQDGRGAHVNVSGAGVAAHAPNRANAIRFIEYLTSVPVQNDLLTFRNSSMPAVTRCAGFHPSILILREYGQKTG